MKRKSSDVWFFLTSKFHIPTLFSFDLLESLFLYVPLAFDCCTAYASWISERQAVRQTENWIRNETRPGGKCQQHWEQTNNIKHNIWNIKTTRLHQFVRGVFANERRLIVEACIYREKEMQLYCCMIVSADSICSEWMSTWIMLVLWTISACSHSPRYL